MVYHMTTPLLKYTIPLKPATVAWLKRTAKRGKIGARALARRILEQVAQK